LTAPPETARLAGNGPAAEQITHEPRVPLAPCDATASGSEDAQVQLAKGSQELALCSHHADLLGLALIAAGWRITCDNRGR
jgi:hypothetical protein